MKFNLPRNLRITFDLLRGVMALSAIFFLASTLFQPWIQRNYVDHPKAYFSAGNARLKFTSGGLTLTTTKGNGDLTLVNLRGDIMINLAGNNRDLVIRVRWVTIPVLMASFAIGLMLLTALRDICANIDSGIIFSEQNLRLLLRTGWLFVGYSALQIAGDSASAAVIGFYINQHVTVAGLAPGIIVKLDWPTVTGGLIAGDVIVNLLIGGCILLVSEACRQGLALKMESELTV